MELVVLYDKFWEKISDILSVSTTIRKEAKEISMV